MYDPEIPVPTQQDNYWRPPRKMPEGTQDWAQRHFLSGGGGDLRNLLMALPFGRQAVSAGAAAPKILSGSGKVREGGSVVEQVLKDWRTNRGKSPESESDWQKVAEMARQRLAGRQRDLTVAVPKENPRDLMTRVQGLGIQPSAQPAHQPPPPQGGGLGALLPGLLQAGQSGAFGGMAQQAKTGFDQFLDTNEEMGRYFLDL